MVDDASILENIFPDRAWKKVMAKLRKKDDIENCSNTSSYFRDLLFERRESEVVIPKVFGILAQRYCDQKNEDESYQETKMESIPWKSQNLSPQMTGLWKCRLVCKKWNEAIEEIHQNEDAGHYQMQGDFLKAKNGELGTHWGTDIFEVESEVVRFLEHFEATHYDSVTGRSIKCPFLGRSVRFDLYVKVNDFGEDETVQDVVFDRMMAMLEKFGREIWYFRFNWWQDWSVGGLVEAYQKLRALISLMPNLKVLRIEYQHSPEKPEKNELQPLEQEIQKNGIPNLANLKMINACCIPDVMFNHLVCQNQQISQLAIWKTGFNGNCTIFKNKLPNLTKLHMEVDSVEIFEQFENCGFSMKLKNLYLCYKLSLPFVRWSRVFSVIQSSCDEDGCTDLRLVMPEPRTDEEKQLVLEDSHSISLYLRNVQRFEIVTFHTRFCLDFLLLCKNSLEQMSLRCGVRYETPEHNKLMEKQVIQFLGFEDKMELSNIANLFSQLKRLKVCIDWQGERRYCIGSNRQVKAEGEL